MANTQLQNITEIFNNKFFRIPDYQRGYAWKEDQLSDFWDDLIYLEDEKFHYTGLITVEQISKSKAAALPDEKWCDDLWLFDKGLKAYYIIDGQQRMLTTIILIKVILDKFSDDLEINYAKKTEWIEKFFFQKSENFHSCIFGYEKDNPSNDYYVTKILGKEDHQCGETIETLYTNNLCYAKKYFAKKINSLTLDDIEKLFRKLVNNFRFNFYEIDDELDVCVTFETMNNRGKPLSKLELLKNRLIYLTTLIKINGDERQRLRREINDVWKTIYEYLGKNTKVPLDDDNFLESHWKIYFKYDRSEANAFSNFLLSEYFTSNRVLQNELVFDNIQKYIKSLAKSVIAWFYIFNPDLSEYQPSACKWLTKLNCFNNKSLLPVVMAVLSKNSEDEEDVSDFLAAVERFTFLVFEVTGRKASTGNSYFYRLGHQYYWDEITIYQLTRDIDDYITDNQYGADVSSFAGMIEENFEKENGGFYGWRGLKYFLYEYENDLQLNCNGEVKIYWKSVQNESIEHIYPQEPKPNSWGREFTSYKKRERYRICNSLGNLLLLSSKKNSEMSNDSFDKKRKYTNRQGAVVGYYNGSYSEIEVAQNQHWRPTSVLERGINMLEFFEKRWKITIPDKTSLLGLSFME